MIDEVVENHGAGGYISYQIDDAGNGHVCYMGGDGPSPQDVKIFYRHEGARGWTEAELVTFMGFTTENNDFRSYKLSMDIDSNGYIHVVYFDYVTMKLTYATNRTGSWEAITPDVPDMVGYFPTLALGADGKARISSLKYEDYLHPADGIYYTTFDGSTWETEQPWEVLNVDPDLVLDQAGNPHIVVGQDSVNYGVLAGDIWNISEEFVGDYFGIHMISLALDGSGDAHLSYYATNIDDYLSSLWYASNAGGQWEDQIIGPAPNYPDYQFTDIATASDASAHIAFFNSGDPKMNYASNKSGAWQNTTIEERDDFFAWDCGRYPTITVHPNGMVHLLYTNQGLKRAIFPQGYTGE